jgi:predicted RND superfamily exporter protein
VIALRGWIVLFYALIVPPAAWLALGIGQDEAIERMIVESDPDAAATRAFQAVFPERRSVLLIAEAEDPMAPAVLAAFRQLEGSLARIPEIATVSAPSIADRLRPGLSSRPEELRSFVRGTSFFRKQALAGDHFLGLVLLLDAPDAKDRDRLLERAEAATLAARPLPFRLRHVGEPLVHSYVERETRTAGARGFPLFGLFVIGLNLFLFRSARALLAVLATLGVSVLLGTAAAGLFGFTTSIVSSIVPLTLLVTATAALVYLHSRYVDCPPGVPREEHQIAALVNKLPPVSASIGAAAVGFGALFVSRIRPVREMGIWTAAGLFLTWAVCFTLFPALQRILRAPTRQERALAGGWVLQAAEGLPRWSYRWRWPLVLGTLLLSALGAAALLGLPGRLPAMPLELDTLDYLPAELAIYEDTRWFEANVSGLDAFSLWIKTPPDGAVDPAFLGRLDAFAERLEQDPRVGSVTGITSILKLRRYAAGQGDALPEDPAGMARTAAELETLLLREPGLRGYVDTTSLAATRLDVLTRAGAPVALEELVSEVRRLWETNGPPGARLEVVGSGLLSDKIGRHLVPTLVESFCLTAAVIFVMFFAVFRSPAARLLAMIPSLFAILAMFLLMRSTGIPLNVATILIATTVLGASENDQIHFFFHFQEKRREAGTEEALKHAVRVAGRAIFFATLVNAGGFLALALSDLPPMRQFGILSASAFFFSMVADFTALPAALWIVFRERPEGA